VDSSFDFKKHFDTSSLTDSQEAGALGPQNCHVSAPQPVNLGALEFQFGVRADYVVWLKFLIRLDL
jgi:hypothetical protein